MTSPVQAEAQTRALDWWQRGIEVSVFEPLDTDDQAMATQFCDRLAAAAKDRGRPLTAEEIEKIGKGETLPPVVKAPTVKTIEDQLMSLEATVRTLAERLESLEKKSVPPHLKGVERR